MLIIFLVLFLVIIGFILVFFIMGIVFFFMVFVGLISLIGIVINNLIVLVDYVNKLREEGKMVMEVVI